MNARCAVVFGQFGRAADPIQLPMFNKRLQSAGVETVLIEHDDTKGAYAFLRGYAGKKGMIGASLGAMSVIVFARYMPDDEFAFCGGFQPSDFDPSGVSVEFEETDPDDLITRAIFVPKNVKTGLVFRNPVVAMTGGLGHATWIADDIEATKLTIEKRLDAHPGDFPPAQDQMLQAALAALEAT